MDMIKERLKLIYGDGYEYIFEDLKRVMDSYKGNKVIKEKRKKLKNMWRDWDSL